MGRRSKFLGDIPCAIANTQQDSDEEDFQLDCAASGFGDSGDEDDGLFFLENGKANKDQKRERENSMSSEFSNMHIKLEDDGTFILEDNNALKAPPARTTGLFGRSHQQKGDTLAAYDKPVSHILDDDDQLMMEMHDKGYSDRQIAERFAKDGRNRYVFKSIGTRIARIRIAQAGLLAQRRLQGVVS